MIHAMRFDRETNLTCSRTRCVTGLAPIEKASNEDARTSIKTGGPRPIKHLFGDIAVSTRKLIYIGTGVLR